MAGHGAPDHDAWKAWRRLLPGRATHSVVAIRLSLL